MKVVFVGSNYNIRQMTDICHAGGTEVVGILDHDFWKNTTHIDGVPVIGTEHDFHWSPEYSYFIATNWIPVNNSTHLRNQKKRYKQIQLLEQHHIQCINLIHPSAVVSNTCILGHGIMIGANAVIGNHCRIGNFCQIREQSYLAHSATLKENIVLQVQSYIGANVLIGNNSYIGIKSSIVPKSSEQLLLPDNSFVKSHSLVTESKNVTPNVTEILNV